MNPPTPIQFESLRNITAGHLSDRIPIVMWEDRGTDTSFPFPYRHLDFMSIFVARVGQGVHFVEGVSYEVHAGDVCAMGIGMAHQFEPSDSLVLDVIHFEPSVFPPEMLEVLSSTEGLLPLFIGTHGGEGSRWLHLHPAAHAQVLEMFRELRDEWEIDSSDRALMVQAGFLRLLVFLARCHHDARPCGSRLVARARAIIDSQYAQPLRIQDLASSFFLSPGRFTEVFRAEVGCSPREYLGQVRVRRAQDLLSATDLTISAIAAQTGFPDPAYFTRFFRQEVGVSPSEFRERFLTSSKALFAS